MNDDSELMDFDEQPSQWLTFMLGKESYAVDVLHVQEVIRCPEITPVPGSLGHVLGIINLRGQVITVNDLRVMLGLSSVALTDQTRIVVIEFNGQVQGVVVEGVTKIINVKVSEIEPTTSKGKGKGKGHFIQGTYQKKDNLYIFMSINELLKIDDE